ncbi:hypothetical protein K439DRAFT_1657587 [Ramaria rubella]|nr:hypothetical protein K439DRAFT_1657587 [Ramaria rubella]
MTVRFRFDAQRDVVVVALSMSMYHGGMAGTWYYYVDGFRVSTDANIPTVSNDANVRVNVNINVNVTPPPVELEPRLGIWMLTEHRSLATTYAAWHPVTGLMQVQTPEAVAGGGI